MYDNQENFIWSDLGNQYREKLLANGHDEVSKYPYSFNFFYGGQEITPAIRRFYYNCLIQGLQPAGSPFENYEYFRSKLYPTFGERFIRKLGVLKDRLFDLPFSNAKILN
jgi:hypothetical protein